MTRAVAAEGQPRTARWAAVAFILPALGFGIPTPFVLDHLRRTGELPMTPFGFRSHGGPFEQVGPDGFQVLGWALVGVCILDALAGLWLWQGKRRGAWLGAAMTPLTLIMAIGFAFPFLLIAIPIRLRLLAGAWARLR